MHMKLKRVIFAILVVAVLIVAPLINKLTYATPTINTYSTPTSSSGPNGIVAGPDGNLWFTEESGNAIGKISTSGSISEYPIPTSNAVPWSITVGPDGALWFTEQRGEKIGRITTSGSITEYNIPTTVAQPDGITAGPDGNLWFTEAGAGKIGKLTPSGTFTEYTIPVTNANPISITSGPDGSLWFADEADDVIGKVTTSGIFTIYTPPSDLNNPTGIVLGPNDNLWFAGGGNIGEVTTSGSFSEYSVPSGNGTYGVTYGSDGNIWFTALGGTANTIGSITPSGSVTQYTIARGASPFSITTGPDGNMWFTEFSKSEIGVLSQFEDSPVTTASLSPTSDPDGTYQNPVTVTLNATATPGFSIADTYYTVDGGSQQTYTGPFNVSGSGSHTLTYWSVDNGGVSESPESSSFLISALPAITNFTANNGTQFSRQVTPFTSGVSTQTINSDGGVTVNVNDAPGYADSGFYLYKSTLGDLPNFTVNSSSGDFGLNLWFDNENLGDFFQWNDSGVMTGLGGDTYGLSSGSSGGALSVNGDTSFFMMDDGQSYTLSQLIAGDDSTSGINSSTPVTVWIGVDTPSGGSASATISSISGL